MIEEIVPIPTPEEGNDLFPLPPDYEDGTAEYQRRARVNAVRQDMLRTRDPALRGLRVRESMRFFDLYYLHPDPEAGFDSFFYDREPLKTPDFHYQLYEAFARYRMNAAVAPRGAAKSTSIFKVLLKAAIAIPKYLQVYATSTQPNAMRAANRMKDAIYSNHRISDDWSPEPEYDGKIKPARGDLPTGSELFHLNNRSGVQSISAQSRQRGMRPHQYWLDDPEYDPSQSTDVSVLREGLENLLMRVIIPMLFRADVGCNWVGTYVTKRHLLWSVTQTVEDENGIARSQDPRFDSWNRIIVPISYDTPEGVTKSVWPEMWPLTRQEKKDKGLVDSVSIEEMPELIGMSAFLSEMSARPGESEATGFGEITPEKHGYWIEDEDEDLHLDPRNSGASIHWYRDGEIQSLDMPDFLRNCRIVAPMDTAYSTGPSSDWKVVGIMAILRASNEMFALDLWHTKGRQQDLIARAFRMCGVWRASMHPEFVSKQGPEFENQCRDYVRNRCIENQNLYLPPVVPHKVGQTPKTIKIEGMGYRFEHGLVKLPFRKEHEEPWNHLFQQIRDFNPDAQDGGLEKDDHIDVLQMGNAILKGRRGDIITSGPDASSITVDLREKVLGGSRSVAGVDPMKHTFQFLTVDEFMTAAEKRGSGDGDSGGGAASVF